MTDKLIMTTAQRDLAMGGVTDRDMIVAAYNAVIKPRSE